MGRILFIYDHDALGGYDLIYNSTSCDYEYNLVNSGLTNSTDNDVQLNAVNALSAAGLKGEHPIF